MLISKEQKHVLIIRLETWRDLARPKIELKFICIACHQYLEGWIREVIAYCICYSHRCRGQGPYTIHSSVREFFCISATLYSKQDVGQVMKNPFSPQNYQAIPIGHLNSSEDVPYTHTWIMHNVGVWHSWHALCRYRAFRCVSAFSNSILVKKIYLKWQCSTIS